jgi:hypothetical protein
MNAEMNKEVAPEPKTTKAEGENRPRKKRKIAKRPSVQESVCLIA